MVALHTQCVASERMSVLRLHINAVGAVMGGAARHLQPFVAALVEVRPEWQLTVHVSTGAWMEGVPGSVSIHRVAARGKGRLVWDSWGVAGYAKTHGASALVCLANYGPLFASVPSILYQRNPVYFDPSWVVRQSLGWRIEAAARRQLAFAQMRAATAIVTPSHAMGAYLRSWRGCPRDAQFLTIHHAVDTTQFTGKSGSPAEQRPRGPVRLLSVSHGAAHKGQDLVIRLVAELISRGRMAEATLTIDRQDQPEYVHGLEALAQALHVSDRVHLAGRVTDVERLYGESDVMVFPSHTESFGFPLLEAMASGLPVIASSIPSSIEVLGSGGLYFAPGDFKSAADHVEYLADADQRAIAERQRELRTRAEGFSWLANAGAAARLVEACAQETMSVRHSSRSGQASLPDGSDQQGHSA